MKEKSAGIVLFPEDIERIAKAVKPQYQFAVILALSRFMESGDLPTEETLGEGGMVAFQFIVDKVKKMADKYKERSERLSRNASARWEKENDGSREQMDADECKDMQTDANECKDMQTNANASKTRTRTRTETKTRTAVKDTLRKKDTQEEEEVERAREADERVEGIDGSDLSNLIRLNEVADAMILRYRIQGNEVTRDALMSDLERYGEKFMDKVLSAAALKNTRDKLTAVFWRLFIEDVKTGRTVPPTKRTGAKDYQTRTFTKEDFAGMEVDLDAMMAEEGG